jgi:small acid-soluble spore protein I (minor)
MNMSLSLRQAIINRVDGKSTDDIQEVIENSIGNAEVLLPGLGVLFEIIWSNSEENDRFNMVNTLHEHLHDAEGQSSEPNPPS